MFWDCEISLAGECAESPPPCFLIYSFYRMGSSEFLEQEWAGSRCMNEDARSVNDANVISRFRLLKLILI